MFIKKVLASVLRISAIYLDPPAPKPKKRRKPVEKRQIVESQCASCGEPIEASAICVGYHPDWDLCATCRKK